MGVVSYAYKLFGPSNLNPGSWGTPVWVHATREDVQTFVELLNELPEARASKATFTTQPSEEKVAWMPEAED
jgi:hypothetical protein